jgi:hypothetical protein
MFGGAVLVYASDMHKALFHVITTALVLAVGGFAQTANTRCAQDSFGPGLTGDSIEAAIKRLQSSTTANPKSEFETTEQYQKRLASATESLVLVIPPSRNAPNAFYQIEETEVKYDADTGTMSVGLARGGHFEIDIESADYSKFQAFDLVSYTKPRPGYVGQNAYGVARRVTGEDETLYGVALSLRSRNTSYGFNAEQLGGKVVFDISPVDAKEVKPFVRLAVCVNAQPRLYKVTNFYQATVTNPHERKSTAYYLDIAVQRLAAYDSRSGKILTSQEPDFEKNPLGK